MGIWFKLGWRNLLKNKRRSFFTIGAISLGFAAVNIVIGFMLYVLHGLEDSYVYTFEGGHLAITKSAETDTDPPAIPFEAEELDDLLTLCRKQTYVELATPRLTLSGLLSNGSTSSIMFAEGKVAKDSRRIRELGRGFVSEIRMFEGQDLADTSDYSIGVSKGLAQKLELSIGSEPITMASTREGYMNALDAQVVQLQDAPLETLDQMLVTLPFAYAQELLETQGADNISILLKDGENLEAAQKQLSQALQAAGHTIVITNWKDLRVSYHRIRSMFNVLFSFILSVVLLIVVLSVINTVSMSAIERTREIGTLRALGLKRSGVIALFSCESTLLGALGSSAGFIVYAACWQTIQILRPTWIPPNIPKRVPWEITWASEYLFISLIAMIALTVLASIIPARSASRLQVAEALIHT